MAENGEVMDIGTVVVVSLLMLSAAVVLMVSHVRSWRACRQAELDAEEFEYRRRQYRRRMQTSAMLAVLAVAMLVGYVLTLWLGSKVFALAFWTGIILVVGWTCLLALVDIWATKHYFGRLRHDTMVEQAKLRAEIRRIQAFRGNGKKDREPGAAKNQRRGDEPS
jgi:hypothetical protein